MLTRRHFVTSAVALGATGAIAPHALAALDPVNPDVKHLLDQVGREARNATLLLFLLGRLQRRRLGPVVGAGIPHGVSFEVAADLAVNDCPRSGAARATAAARHTFPSFPILWPPLPRRGSRYGNRVG